MDGQSAINQSVRDRIISPLVHVFTIIGVMVAIVCVGLTTLNKIGNTSH
jgi:hypothetical protein